MNFLGRVQPTLIPPLSVTNFVIGDTFLIDLKGPCGLLYKNKFSGQDWSKIKAVKNKRVYKAPMGIYRWDAPCVETPLMIKWLGKVFHPDVFTDYDIRADLKSFYQTYFNHKLTDPELDQILSSKLNPDLKI